MNETALEKLAKEIEGFESFESYCHYNQIPAAAAQKMLAYMQAKGANTIQTGQGGKPVKVSAQFTFNISAPNNVNGGQAAGSYNVPLFGSQDEFARFADGILAAYNGGSGLALAYPGYPEVVASTVPAAAGAAANSLAWYFTYYTPGQAATYSTWNITCVEYPYTSFLPAQLNNKMKLTKLRWTLNTATVTSQYNQPFQKAYRTLFGSIHFDKLTVAQFKGPMQFQNGILDVDLDIKIGAKDFLILALNPQDGGSGSSMGFFVETFERWDDHKGGISGGHH